MKKAIHIILILVFTANIFAQSPNAFKYQTIVRDNSGNVVSNKSVEIIISIIQGSVNGSAVYSETHSSTTNQFGQVNLEIGNGTLVSGNFSTINWATGPYFVKITLGGNDIGTSQLLSVPYAKYADMAGNGFSGDYNDLTNKPTFFDGSWSAISGKPLFAGVAISGSYNDLKDVPVIFDGTWSSMVGKPTFSAVATTGSYNDLINKPDFSWASLTAKPNTLAGYGITDAISTSHVVFGITSSLISNWNTAYSWGDHSTKGYAIAVNYYSKINLQTGGQSLIHWNNIIGSSRPTTLAGYGITDAMSTSHVANGITSTQLANWNTAFGWGNHASAGYAHSTDYYSKTELQTSGLSLVHWNNVTNEPTTLSGYGITDAMSSAHPANGITSTQISNWNTAFGWGNHALAGYAVATNYYSKTNLQTTGQAQVNWGNVTNNPTTLSGYGITDAMSTSHVANGITNTQISNWNSAYGWGNHALAGYVVGTNYYTKTNLQTSGQASVHWGNITNKATTLAGYGITDFSISSPIDNQLLKYNSTSGKWENWTPNFAGGGQLLSLSGNVLTISGTPGNSVTFTNWDTNSTDDVTTSGNQSIDGNKTFTGTLTTSLIINATNGLNANNNRITNVADPTISNDAATKAYADLLKAKITLLETKIQAIETKLGL